MKCKICGKRSIFSLKCRYCKEVKVEEKVVTKPLLGKCMFCEKSAKYSLCGKCYREKLMVKSELESSFVDYEKTKEYYNNLKYNIIKVPDIDSAINGCIKLVVIGEILEKKFKEKRAFIKSKFDVSDILKKKRECLANNKELDEVVEVEDNEWKDFRKVYPMNIRCKDGHYVRSKAEKLIDDYLFDNQIMHIYEKRIINEGNNETYYPDFYLPYLINNKGVYIEYFGLEDNEKYIKKEKKKLNYYSSKGYDVIEVREANISSIDDFLEDKIREVKKKYK